MAWQGAKITQQEFRRESRVRTALPVILESAKGVTRDVSPRGVFFWTEGGAFTPGDRIRFAVQIDGPAGRMRLVCQGEIIRTEHNEAMVGVAVRINESALKYA